MSLKRRLTLPLHLNGKTQKMFPQYVKETSALDWLENAIMSK